MAKIYFDNNATCLLDANIKQQMFALMDEPLNASSTHKNGRKARLIKEAARAKILASVNAKNCNLVFTATGTEANNLALNGLTDYQVFAGATEHPSVLKVWEDAKIINVDSNGLLNLEHLKELLQQHKGNCLVSVMYANNETGVIQNIKQVADIAHEYGAIVHSDAVQAYGKIAIDFAALGVDMLTVSAHKSGGPQGVGALIHKKSVPLKAIIRGGGQELNLRSGTENIVSIFGFGLLAEYLDKKIDAFREVAKLRDYLEQEILKVSRDSVVFGSNVQRLPNTTYVTMKDVSREAILMNFDLLDIAISAGSACSSGTTKLSHVLIAMGAANNVAESAVRISLAPGNSYDEADQFVKEWRSMYLRTSNKAA